MTREPAETPGLPADSPQICNCMKVSEATLRAAIRAGAKTVAALRFVTRANTGCGTCRPDLLALLAEERKRVLEQRPRNPDALPKPREDR